MSTDNSSTSYGGYIAVVGICVGVFLFFLVCISNLCKGNRTSRDDNAAIHAAAAATALAARPPEPPAAGYWDDDEQDRGEHGRSSRRASPTDGLPSFKYNPSSVKHNVPGGGGEAAAATCSVCLGAFQAGETVRLLPVCLHLYHVECVDPWLDAHATCPICRTGIDPTTGGSLLPPV